MSPCLRVERLDYPHPGQKPPGSEYLEMSANQTLIDRLTETLALFCIAAAVVILVHSAKISPVEGSLAGLTVQKVSEQDMDRFQSLLNDARRLVDTNRDPGTTLGVLKEEFPGRHEVWALAARHEESDGLKGVALVSYARAVKLQPGYLDEKSDFFLGKRIEALTDDVMDRMLMVRKKRALGEEEKKLMKTAYFLKRRIAGGCE